MNTKESVADSLLKLMKKKKFETITIKELTNLAGVYRSTYYRNFNSKEDVIKYKLSDIMDEYLDRYNRQEETSKEKYFLVMFETFRKYEDFLKTIYMRGQLYLLQQVLQDYFKSRVPDNILERYEMYYHIGGIYNFIICWIDNDMRESPEELMKISMKITEGKTPYLK